VKAKRVPLLAPLAVVTLFVMHAPASGQGIGGPEYHRIRVGFGGGMSVPTSHAADALKNGINGQGYVLFDPGIGFPLRFNVGYQKFDYKAGGFGANSSTGSSKILSGVAGLSVDLFRAGPVRPYLTAGLGAFNVKDEIATAGATASASTTKFGIDGGGGLALKLGRLEAFVEGRVQNVYTDHGAVAAKSIRSIPVTFGVLF